MSATFPNPDPSTVAPLKAALHSALNLEHHLDALQEWIGRGNAKRGFHEEGDALRNPLPQEAGDEAALRNYYITKLALIGTEVSEAIEELRNGRAVDERYYSGGVGYAVEGDIEEFESVDASDCLRKPEGVPSELADIVIRAFDFADEAGFSLGEVILEKLRFNATRPFKHGKEV